MPREGFSSVGIREDDRRLVDQLATEAKEMFGRGVTVADVIGACIETALTRPEALVKVIGKRRLARSPAEQGEHGT